MKYINSYAIISIKNTKFLLQKIEYLLRGRIILLEIKLNYSLIVFYITLFSCKILL